MTATMPETITLTHALRVNGIIKMGDSKPTDQSQKVSLLARTPHPAWLPGLGTFVNDFAGMSTKPNITIDWAHDGNLLIGKASGYVVDENGLTINAFLDGKTEMSRNVIEWLRDNYGLQCSITFDIPDSDAIDFLAPGSEIVVNGVTVTAGADGLAIVRRWNLLACAICQLGADGNTSATVSMARTYKINQIGVTKMENQEAVDAKGNVETEAVVEPAVDVEKPVDAEAPKEAVVEEKKDEVVEPVVTEELKLSVADVKLYCETFGQEFALAAISDGLTMNQAKDRHYEQLKATIAELSMSVDAKDTEINTLKAQVQAMSASPAVKFESSDKGGNATLSATDRLAEHFRSKRK